MRVGILGRTEFLLETARRLAGGPHEIAFVATASAAEYSLADERAYEEFAAEHGVPFFADNRITRRREELSADVVLSMNWPTVLPQAFLDHFPLGVLNAHAGDLPRYRGNATLNWAILNGEPRGCLSIHRMAPELDAGPVALKIFHEIHDDVDITDLFDWLADAVPAAFLEVVRRIDDGTVEFVEQDPAIRPLRAYPRRPEDSRIDWSRPRAEILRLIRASARPFAGAFCSLEGDRPVVILRARAYDAPSDFLAMPGQVCFGIDGRPVIAAGDGMVEILECSDDAMMPAILSSLRNRLS